MGKQEQRAATSTWSRTHCGWFPATPKTKPHNVVDDDIALCLAIILPRHDWGSSWEGRGRGNSRGEGETGRLAAKLSKTLLFVLSGRLRGARSQDCLLYIFGSSTARVLPLPVASCQLPVGSSVLPSLALTVHKVNFATEIMLKRYMEVGNIFRVGAALW